MFVCNLYHPHRHSLPARLRVAALCAVGVVFWGYLAPAAEPAAADKPMETSFASAEASRAEYDRTVAPFFARHCLACHNANKSSGDLDLEALDPDMKATTSGARWAGLVDKLTKGEMPPKGKPRPDAQGVRAVLRWAHAEAKRAGKHFARRRAYANGNEVPHVIAQKSWGEQLRGCSVCVE